MFEVGFCDPIADRQGVCAVAHAPGFSAFGEHCFGQRFQQKDVVITPLVGNLGDDFRHFIAEVAAICQAIETPSIEEGCVHSRRQFGLVPGLASGDEFLEFLPVGATPSLLVFHAELFVEFCNDGDR